MIGPRLICKQNMTSLSLLVGRTAVYIFIYNDSHPSLKHQYASHRGNFNCEHLQAVRTELRCHTLQHYIGVYSVCCSPRYFLNPRTSYTQELSLTHFDKQWKQRWSAAQCSTPSWSTQFTVHQGNTFHRAWYTRKWPPLWQTVNTP